MRYLYGTLVGLLIGTVLIFALQNGNTVTISFLTMSASLPLALLVIVVYVSGMLTGGSLWALARIWFHRAGRK